MSGIVLVQKIFKNIAGIRPFYDAIEVMKDKGYIDDSKGVYLRPKVKNVRYDLTKKGRETFSQ